MTVEKISGSISTKEWGRTGAANLRPPDHQWSTHPTELPSPTNYTGRKMDENQGDFREEQRAYCKIHGLLGKSASEFKSELDTVYRENTIPYRTVARWVSYFKEGRSSVKDEARPGRSVSATSENAVATVPSIV